MSFSKYEHLIKCDLLRALRAFAVAVFRYETCIDPALVWIRLTRMPQLMHAVCIVAGDDYPVSVYLKYRSCQRLIRSPRRVGSFFRSKSSLGSRLQSRADAHVWKPSQPGFAK